MSKSVDGSGERGERSFDHADTFEGVKRTYSDKEALNFAIHSFSNHEYLDIHCSVFTRESFIKIIQDLISLELLCVDILEHSDGDEEFFVKLKKRGNPKFQVSDFNSSNAASAVSAELTHLRRAYAEAIAMQEELKKGWLRKLVAKITRR